MEAKENTRLANFKGHYVRPGLNRQALGWIEDFLRDNKSASKLSWQWMLTNPGNDADAGQWKIEVRVDITTPRKELDQHGGCPHAQITTIYKDAKRSINAKEPEDSHVLKDTDSDNEIFQLVYPDPKSAKTAFPQPLLRWLASRLLARAAFERIGTVDQVIAGLSPVDGEQRKPNVKRERSGNVESVR